jgi:phosphoribosylformimino-5-aminoimidazole carboxamide ribotide isomerase
MDVIPVIDLKSGLVVRARQGDRASYRPIATPLSPTSEPADVIAGLLSLHPFRTLYAADLDAIEGSGDHLAQLAQLASERPDLAVWVDNGCATLAAAEAFLAASPRASLVLGSESQRDPSLLEMLSRHPRVILSLDFRGESFIGPEALLREPGLWPDRIILMTLARVGSGAGPDLERFAGFRARAGSRRIYLAGGLRDRGDLAAAEASGAAGILAASALHDGRLTPADLAAFASPNDAPG